MFFFPRRIAFLPFLALMFTATRIQAQSDQRGPRVEGIRFWSFGDVTRIAIETSGEYQLYTERIENPDRVFFDLNGLQPPSAAQRNMQTITVNDKRIRQIRVARVSGTKTRIVFDLDCPVEVGSSQLVNPDRLMIEVRPKGAALPTMNATKSVMAEHKVDLTSHINSVDSDMMDTDTIQKPAARNISVTAPKAVRDDAADAFHPHASAHTEVAAASLPLPARTIPSIDLSSVEKPGTSGAAGVAAAARDSAGDRSLVRVLGLKMGRIVIDAGHGGHDSGTVGPNGLQEKELVLDVALRLGRLITKQLGAEVIYTRSTDVFIPLEQRTKIANDQKADLFISVHANSSPEPAATGVETYYFNLTSDKGGVDLATRENATADSSISDLSDLLHRAVLQTKKEESREFAQKIQASLIGVKSSSQARDRGVRQAPFVVLIGATMPSILAEIGFVSNPRDEKQLRRPDQRQKIAEALFRGVVQYSNSLSHVQMARAGAE